MKYILFFSALFAPLVIFADSEAHVKHANRAAHQGNHTNSLDHLNQAIQEDPSNAHAYKVRANVYFAQGDHQAALQDLNKCVELQPQSALAYGNRAILHLAMNNHGQAINDVEKALKLSPNSAYLLTIKDKIHSDVTAVKKKKK